MQAMSTETFIGNMRGPVVRRMDADYDGVRSLYNGMIAPILPYILLILVLIFRPTGLFGKKMTEKV